MQMITGYAVPLKWKKWQVLRSSPLKAVARGSMGECPPLGWKMHQKIRHLRKMFFSLDPTTAYISLL